jgi:hypothetical protein
MDLARHHWRTRWRLTRSNLNIGVLFSGLIEHMCQDEEAPGTDAIKFPRGILNYGNSGHVQSDVCAAGLVNGPGITLNVLVRYDNSAVNKKGLYNSNSIVFRFYVCKLPLHDS